MSDIVIGTWKDIEADLVLYEDGGLQWIYKNYTNKGGLFYLTSIKIDVDEWNHFFIGNEAFYGIKSND